MTFAGLKAKDNDKSHKHTHTAETGPDKSSGFIKDQPTLFKINKIGPVREYKAEKEIDNPPGMGQIP